MIRILFIAVFLVFLNVTPVSAQTLTDAEYKTELLAIIANLQEQIVLLQAQLKDLQGEQLIASEAFSSFILKDESAVQARYRLANSRDVQAIVDIRQRQYFSRLFELLPNEFDSYINELVVFENTDSFVDAFVETIPPYRINTWRFALDESMFRVPLQSDAIRDLFIHEIAHIISYDDIPNVSLPRTAKCHEYFLEYGCPPGNSYLPVFTDTFWSESDLDELNKAESGDPIWSNRELEREFVSEYAGTNPQEDFAESFTLFVTKPKPTGSQLRDDKIRFFYQYEELLAFRLEILQNSF